MRIQVNGSREWGRWLTIVKLPILALAMSGAEGWSEEPPSTVKSGAVVRGGAHESRRFSAKVFESGTKKPISGAKVTVRRFILPDPKSGWKRVLRETEHLTDGEGKYHFVITSEEMAEPRLGVVVLVEHPDYLSDEDFYYDLQGAFKNVQFGDSLSFDLEVHRGEPITGVVESPDGKPVAGVVIRVMSSFSPEAKPGQLVLGFPAETRTDEQGRFRLMVLTPGDVELKLFPEKYAVSVHQIENNQRGDLGRFTLRKGAPVTGKVLGAEGKPLAGVTVNVAGFSKEPERTELPPLSDDAFWNTASGSLTRSTVSNAAGEFATLPMPPGVYRVLPVEFDHDALMGETFRRLPAPFLPVRLTLKEGEVPKPLEIRPQPYLVIEANVHNSKGKPLADTILQAGGNFSSTNKPQGADLTVPLIGNGNETHWSSMSCPDATGKLVFHAPRGVEYASIQWNFFSSEHHCVRYRIGKDLPLLNDYGINLFTLEPKSLTLPVIDTSLNHDVKDIEIVFYESPTVLVKVADKAGSKPQGIHVSAIYGDQEKTSGPSGQRFIAQADGRYRSQRLLPDKTVTVVVEAEGFQRRTEILRLPEGTVKELNFVLEKK